MAIVLSLKAKLRNLFKAFSMFICKILCGLFLFSNLRVSYLSFGFGGFLGFILGCLNTTFIHFLFMQIYSYAFTGFSLLKLPKHTISTILFSGTLFSCNAAYAAILYKIDFLIKGFFLIYYIFFIPVLFNLIILWHYKEFPHDSSALKQFAFTNRLLLCALGVELLLMSLHVFTLQFIILNNFLIYTVLWLHLRVNHQKFSNLTERTLKVNIIIDCVEKQEIL